MSGLRALGIGIACTLAIGAGLSAAVAHDLVIHPGSHAVETGWPSRGPNCGAVPDQQGPVQLWLGHFSGGRLEAQGAAAGGLAWTSEHSCFPSRASCEQWQRELRASYRQVEGYRTCLQIR